MIFTNFAISTVWISHKNSFHFRPTLYESILRSYIKQRFTTIFFSPKIHCLQKITNIGCRLRPYKAFTVQGFFSALFSRKIFSKSGQDNFLPHLVLHFFKLAFWLDFILFFKDSLCWWLLYFCTICSSWCLFYCKYGI